MYDFGQFVQSTGGVLHNGSFRTWVTKMREDIWAQATKALYASAEMTAIECARDVRRIDAACALAEKDGVMPETLADFTLRSHRRVTVYHFAPVSVEVTKIARSDEHNIALTDVMHTCDVMEVTESVVDASTEENDFNVERIVTVKVKHSSDMEWLSPTPVAVARLFLSVPPLVKYDL